MEPLPKHFYDRDTVETARALLGQYLVRTLPNGSELVCRITETEAYVGRMDKACHAYGYKRTSRTETLFAPPGLSLIHISLFFYYAQALILRKGEVFYG